MVDLETRDRFWKKVDVRGPEECWEWQASVIEGYGRFRAQGEHFLSHRFVFMLEHDTAPGDSRVLHDCDNPPCVNPRHLHLGDAADNMNEAVERLAANQGENNGQAKLSETDVVRIRRLYDTTSMTQYEIADRFNVSQDRVSRITREIAWKHVPGVDAWS